MSKNQDLLNKLATAVEKNNIEAAKKLLEEGVDPNSLTRDRLGRKTSIIPSITSIEMAELFRAHGADLTTLDSSRENLFIHAIKATNIDFVRFCLANGFDASYIDLKGLRKTTLMYAVDGCMDPNSENIVEIFNLLLKAGADPNKKDIKGGSLAYRLLSNGCTDHHTTMALLNVLDDEKYDFTEVTPSVGKTLLHTAVRIDENTADVLHFLINKGVNIDAQDTEGNTALTDAINSSNIMAIETLLQEGASVNLTDKLGRTPLLRAAESTNTRGVRMSRLLLGAPSNNTSLSRENRLSNKSNRPDINHQNSHGVTALYIAAGGGIGEADLDLVNLYLQHGANPNLMNNDGITPFHVAIQKRDMNIIRNMLQHGADPLQVDKQGNTPMDMVNQAVERRIYSGTVGRQIRTLLEKGIRNRTNAAQHVMIRRGNQRGQVMPSAIARTVSNFLRPSAKYMGTKNKKGGARRRRHLTKKKKHARR